MSTWKSIFKERGRLFDELWKVINEFHILVPSVKESIHVTVLESTDGTFYARSSHYPKSPDAMSEYHPSGPLGFTPGEALENLFKAWEIQYISDDPATIKWVKGE